MQLHDSPLQKVTESEKFRIKLDNRLKCLLNLYSYPNN